MALRDHELEDIVLHLPAALRERAEEMASRECLSLNLFLLMAIAEKVQHLQLQHSPGRSDELATGMSSTGSPHIQ